MLAVSGLGEGFADREAGIEANLAAANVSHRDDLRRVQAAFAICVRSRARFNADVVDKIVLHSDPRPYDRLLLASVMSRAARDGVIVEDFGHPRARSSRRSRRGSVLRWWRAAAREATAQDGEHEGAA